MWALSVRSRIVEQLSSSREQYRSVRSHSLCKTTSIFKTFLSQKTWYLLKKKKKNIQNNWFDSSSLLSGFLLAMALPHIPKCPPCPLPRLLERKLIPALLGSALLRTSFWQQSPFTYFHCSACPETHMHTHVHAHVHARAQKQSACLVLLCREQHRSAVWHGSLQEESIYHLSTFMGSPFSPLPLSLLLSFSSPPPSIKSPGRSQEEDKSCAEMK